MPEYYPQNQEPEAHWDYTMKSKEAYGDAYKNRHQISRDSEISGGVYFGTYGGEAIVVDPDKYPGHYQKLYDQIIDRAREVNPDGSKGKIRKDRILGSVFSSVRVALPYSLEGVDTALLSIDKFESGAKVDLSFFLDRKIGVCRHQALACGVMLERLAKEGIINGKVSVDRNELWSPNGDRGGHAWARYTNSGGEVYILDVAQNYIGTLRESEGRLHGWDYMRPEERRQVAAAQISPLITEDMVPKPGSVAA